MVHWTIWWLYMIFLALGTRPTKAATAVKIKNRIFIEKICDGKNIILLYTCYLLPLGLHTCHDCWHMVSNVTRDAVLYTYDDNISFQIYIYIYYNIFRHYSVYSYNNTTLCEKSLPSCLLQDCKDIENRTTSSRCSDFRVGTSCSIINAVFSLQLQAFAVYSLHDII